MRRLAIMGLLAAVLGACGCQAAWLPRSNRPEWVNEPAQTRTQGEFLSAVGVAAAGEDPEPARALADLSARDELRDAIADYTRSAMTGFLTANRQYPPPTSALSAELVDILRTEVAANILRLAMREKTWQAPDNRVYVLYRVPLALVNSEISQRTRDTVVYVNPFGSSSDQAVADLDGYLDALLRERLKETARERPNTVETPPEQKTPAWLETGRHERYPADRYYTAVGLGKDLPAAEASARSELAFRLNAQLDRLLARLPAIPSAAALSTSLQWMGPDAVAFTDSDLSIARVVEHWHDPITSTFYTFAVLDPSSAASTMRGRITAARDNAQNLLTSARNHQRAENYAASLRAFGEAVAAAREAVSIQAKAAAMAPRSMDEIMALMPDPVLDEACQGLRGLLAGFRLEGVQGDLQWTLAGHPPEQAFVVKISAGEPAAPVGGLPVRFLKREAGSALGQVTTDADGVARWTMAAALPVEPISGAVVAEVDLAAARLPVESAHLSSPRVEFRYVVRSTANTRLVLVAKEKTDAGRFPASSTAQALEDALIGAGFQFVSHEDVLQHVPVVDLGPDADDSAIRDTFAALRETLGPYRCLLVVIGEFQPHVAETTPVEEGDLFFARCPWRFRAVDNDLPGEQRTVIDITGTASAAYLGDQAEALKRARAEGERQATAQLVKALRTRYGED